MCTVLRPKQIEIYIINFGVGRVSCLKAHLNPLVFEITGHTYTRALQLVY